MPMAAPMMAADAAMPAEAALALAASDAPGDAARDGGTGGPGGPEQRPGPDLSQVSARKNLNETAFFFPHLIAATKGEVSWSSPCPKR